MCFVCLCVSIPTWLLNQQNNLRQLESSQRPSQVAWTNMAFLTDNVSETVGHWMLLEPLDESVQYVIANHSEIPLKWVSVGCMPW